MKTSHAIFFLFTVFSLIGCIESEVPEPPSDEEVRQRNSQLIQEYLSANDLEAERTSSDLFYIVTTQGNGRVPTIDDSIRVTYKLYDLRGNVIQDQTQPTAFALNEMIAGWQEGIPKFSEGGGGTLFVPSHLAYFNRPPSNNEPLAFDVSLIEVKD